MRKAFGRLILSVLALAAGTTAARAGHCCCARCGVVRKVPSYKWIVEDVCDACTHQPQDVPVSKASESARLKSFARPRTDVAANP